MIAKMEIAQTKPHCTDSSFAVHPNKKHRCWLESRFSTTLIHGNATRLVPQDDNGIQSSFSVSMMAVGGLPPTDDNIRFHLPEFATCPNANRPQRTCVNLKPTSPVSKSVNPYLAQFAGCRLGCRCCLFSGRSLPLLGIRQSHKGPIRKTITLPTKTLLN